MSLGDAGKSGHPGCGEASRGEGRPPSEGANGEEDGDSSLAKLIRLNNNKSALRREALRLARQKRRADKAHVKTCQEPEAEVVVINTRMTVGGGVVRFCPFYFWCMNIMMFKWWDVIRKVLHGHCGNDRRAYKHQLLHSVRHAALQVSH